MFLKKKWFTVILMLCIAVTTVLSGCSQDKSTGSTGSTGGESVLTFWTFSELHQQFYENAAVTWNEQNPDRQIKLEATTYPYQDMHNNLLLSLQSGVGAPDIADIEISKFANYTKGDTPPLENLNDIVDPLREKMVESRLAIYSKDGNVYGLPTHVGAAVMYYNVEILGQAGVNVDEIRTWADYAEAAKKVLNATGKPMTTFETSDQWNFWPLIKQQASDYFGQNGEVIIDNQVNIDTLSFMLDMINAGTAVTTPGGNHHAEEYYGFMAQGQAASVLMPIWYMGRFLEYMPDLKNKVVIRPLPAWTEGGKRSAGMGGTGTVVTNQAKDKQLAKDFLAHAKLSEEANIKIWTILGFDPPRWDVWESAELSAENEYTEYFGPGIFDMLLEIRSEIDSPVTNEKTPLASDLIKTQVLFKVLEGKSATPEEALKQAAAELSK